MASSLYTAECSERLSGAPPGADPSNGYRSEFRRDYGRLMHSASFRRLQGKMQLFPSVDSEFFRNRLTHSLEVAQIAKCIALNANRGLPQDAQIDLDLVEFAGLAHDLGHPPFGHVGETTLHLKMAKFGGFEGNAQTLRILCGLECKRPPHGLDLTLRSLASVLKYDACIPRKDRRGKPEPIKGYYQTEKAVVNRIKAAVAPDFDGKFKTVECDIMDFADDVAYSTYDIEDALKARFITPLNFLTVWTNERLSSKLLESVRSALVKHGEENPPTRLEIGQCLFGLALRAEIISSDIQENVPGAQREDLYRAATIMKAADAICDLDEKRTAFTAGLIHDAVQATKVELNDEFPSMSRLKVPREDRIRVEVLKEFAYLSMIDSHRIRIVAERAREIIGTIFDSVQAAPSLLPDSDREIFLEADGDEYLEARVICDFIAKMTDAQAVEFYGRLKSEEHQTIFKPVT